MQKKYREFIIFQSMQKKQITFLILAVLVLVGIFTWLFLQKQETKPVVSEKAIPQRAEENFYKYLELPSRSGMFINVDETKLEININYFDIETMKIKNQAFRIDAETIFSKAAFDPYQPDLFPKKGFQEVKRETTTKIFYLPPEKEDEIPLARLIQVQASF